MKTETGNVFKYSDVHDYLSNDACSLKRVACSCNIEYL